MKKRLIGAVLLAFLLARLCGCGLSLSVSEKALGAGESDPLSPIEWEKDTLPAGREETASLPETEAAPLVAPQTVCLWARGQLSPAARETYDRLSAAIACRQEAEVEVESSSGEVQLVLTALRIDHPEYFWFNGEASYVTTTVPLMGTRNACRLCYTMDAGEISQRLAQVEQFTSECLSSRELAGAERDYDKILGVYRYIISHTDYVLSETDQSFISVMTDRQGTCAGYARTFQYLMHQLGIPCTLALGSGSGGENHGWNIVQCQGQWYHVDVTWGDPVGQDGLPGSSLSYTYCMVTDGEIFRDHSLSGDIPMPPCGSTAWNYYRQSGRQMAAWDSAVYEALLLGAAETGEGWFTVRFDRQEDYTAAVAFLVEQGEIMPMLRRCGYSVPDAGVTYSQNDGFWEFSLQLPPLA